MLKLNSSLNFISGLSEEIKKSKKGVTADLAEKPESAAKSFDTCQS